MGQSLRAQGVWLPGFNHLPNNIGQVSPYPVDPASDSIANPGRWITENLIPAQQVFPHLPGQGMNTVHVCLIPSGVHRGEVLVLDGSLPNYGVRAYQPWSIVNPYWPALNPNYWPGQTALQYRFHNATIVMTTEGELFCGGQCWMADGRLLFAGGTKAYPIASPTDPGGFVGSRYVYQWDHTPQTGDPFGRWWRMADLETERWYPTVTYDGTTAHRGIVIGGTVWMQGSGVMDVNSYEVVRPVFNSQPFPMLQPTPNDFDRKPAATSPTWNPTLSSARQYWGAMQPNQTPTFGDYPRIHALGVLDPITNGTAPRLFVSGFNARGIRWAHDPINDPVFGSSWTTGQGFEFGQFPANSDEVVYYATSLLLPGPISAISNKVARFGGRRGNGGLWAASNLVETAKVLNSLSSPSSWETGPALPPMNHIRFYGNVVMLPNGDLFAIGGQKVAGVTAPPNPATDFNMVPELFDGTTWSNMAAHQGARDYHSAAILLPDGRVFVCGGEFRKNPNLPFPGPGPDYLIWEPPYFNLTEGSVPATGITVRRNDTTYAIVPQDLIGAPDCMTYGRTYRADWTNTLESGISIDRVVLMRPAALTHHDDGGQRMVRLNAWDDGTENTVLFQSPASVLHAPPGWWMLFLVNSAGRPSQAYWVNLG